jgi:DNA-binding transcriptional LysR family regulator
MLQATFRQLQIFMTVAREGGFARAAHRLDISQAGVSHHVRALERQLDCRLFERRSGSTPVLSPQGEALLKQVPALLERASAVASLGAAEAAPGDLMIRVGAGEHLLEHLFRPNFARFQLENPRLQVAFERVESARDAVAGVRRGRLDLAYLTTYRTGLDELDILASIKVGLFVSPGHPLASTSMAGVGRVTSLPLILPLAGSGQERAIFGLLDAAGLVEREPVARAQYAETMVALAVVGVGACCVFRESASAELAAGRLVELDLELPPVFRCAVRSPSALAQEHLRAFDRFAAALIQASGQDALP